VDTQIRALASAGFGEVVLSGIHLAAFGRGAGGLLALLRRLESTPPGCRVRLSSLEPMEAGEALVAHVASSRVVVPHLHLPLQSGSDAVLRRMRRGITVARFLRLVESARRASPRLHLSTDLIAGFPGETETEHEESCVFAEALRPGSLHVFPFSPRSGTPAAEMPGRLPPAVVAARAAQLRELGARAAAAFVARADGTVADVLALKGGRGLTDNYLEVRLGAGSPEPGGRFSALLRRDAEGRRLDAWPVYNPVRGDIDSAAPNP
jgi:threonylcarbamoyladenosine tRNA methylthiotransferase MtaB